MNTATPPAPVQAPADPATPVHARHRGIRAAAAARGGPLATILVTVAVVALTYLAGKLAYRLRDIILIMVVAGFLALILNPLVVALQRWRIRRRGWAVTVATLWSVLVFAGLLAAFGYPLAHGVTHFSQQLPSYVDRRLGRRALRQLRGGPDFHPRRSRASGHRPGTVAGHHVAAATRRRSGRPGAGVETKQHRRRTIRRWTGRARPPRRASRRSAPRSSRARRRCPRTSTS